ncbi:DUF2194 domain-containing protein [Brevibacillus humidisoli]|uniref:DUF2194 domain-containing protein n=1 Tax=Brevibacillus humidisoli TaxID=2895522 RepID=UPI001E497AC2|nr:DUF2194 domain-containing protein [Brevibacillus humidisoli]UFJ41048.1 DUF2194 domain-containing protein [Brevibacillus humidisoli]
MLVRSQSLKRIIVLLAFVLLLTLLMHMSRSDILLQLNQYGTAEEQSAEIAPRDALTADEWKRMNQARLMVLYEPGNPSSEKITHNVEQTLISMKKSYRLAEVGGERPDLQQVDAIMVTFSDLSLLGELGWLDRYVAEGGHVLFATVPDLNDAFYTIYRKLGILEIGAYLEANVINLHTNILIGHAGDTFVDPNLPNEILRVKLADSSRVHATAENGVPLVWEAPYGKGSFLICNGTMLLDTASRGLLAGALGMMLPDFIYPVINTKVMYIDDFPAPFPLGTNPSIYREYQLDLPQFYKKVWWPDMIRLGQAYDLVYTGALIATYEDDVTPPFDWQNDADLANLILYGRELLKEGGEIAVHGYNHQSLTTTRRISFAFGYNQWSSIDEMTQSLRAVREYIEAAFPHYRLRTYVPPSNALGPEGREAVKEALPDVRAISSLAGEDGRNLSYLQEYGVAEDGIVEMPRITYGYWIGAYEQWSMANAVTVWGVFSHFVHPDDILDQKRSEGKGWSELYADFERFVALVHERHGWLRSMTAADASVQVKRWALSKPVFEYRPDGVYGYVNNFTGELYFVLRSDRTFAKANNCKVLRIDEGVYLVRAQQETFSIEWTEEG